MIRNTHLLLILTILIASFTACNKYKSFSTLQEEEEVKIQDYIQKNNLVIVSDMPKASEWTEKTYYKTPAGAYFHLIQAGETTGDSVHSNITVGYRFIEYEMDEKQTIRLKNWEVRDFEEPSSLIYSSLDAINNYGTGLHEALGLMKYKGAEAYVIVPSNLNVSYYSEGYDRLIPVIYKLKITVIR